MNAAGDLEPPGSPPLPRPAFPWDDLMTIGLNRLLWPPAAFWAATPREIAAALGPRRQALSRGDLDRLLAAHPD